MTIDLDRRDRLAGLFGGLDAAALQLDQLRHLRLLWPQGRERLGAGNGRLVIAEPPAKVAAYRGARTSLEGRVFFIATDQALPAAVYLTLIDPIANGPRIERNVAAGYLVRTRADFRNYRHEIVHRKLPGLRILDGLPASGGARLRREPCICTSTSPRTPIPRRGFVHRPITGRFAL